MDLIPSHLTLNVLYKIAMINSAQQKHLLKCPPIAILPRLVCLPQLLPEQLRRCAFQKVISQHPLPAIYLQRYLCLDLYYLEDNRPFAELDCRLHTYYYITP